MFTLRKSILSVSICLTAVCIMSFTTVKGLAVNSVGTIKGENINVRAEPTTASTALGKLSNQKVTILSRQGKWYKISCGNITGWVRYDLITPEETITKNNLGLVKGNNVNIRSNPDINSKIITQLSNKNVKILETSGNWYKISYDNITGWIHKDLVFTTKTTLSSRNTTNIANTSFSYINGINVNIRTKPSLNSEVVTKLSNKKVTILEQSEDWYKISSGNTTGWVLSKFVSTDNTRYINGLNVNIRTKPDLNSEVVTRFSNKKVTVLQQSGDWYKISSDNITGWVHKDFISTTTPSQRNRLILYSRNFLGVRYVYGGNTPKGFDCSGFTKYVFSKFGITLERKSTVQATQGTYVPKSQLKPGDLVAFDTNGGSKKVVNHVGIYIGNGNFIHASSSTSGRQVRISNLNSGFYKKAYVTGRRFLK